VKPAPFVYHVPATVDEVLMLLAEDDGAQVLAGGQSLVQLMKLRQAKPSALIDINGVSGLDGLEERDGELRVGALVRQQTLLEDERVRRSWPLVADALQYVGYKTTRHRGTIGGSLAYAAPWAELTAVAVALDATIDVRSRRADRSIPARSFFLGPYATALEKDELIVGVRLPAPKAGTGSAFHEVSVRYRDYAQVAAAAVVSPGAAEVVLLGVAETPFVVELAGPEDDALESALASTSPQDDVEASAEYRRLVAPVLARRALHDAQENTA
jgi:CO/xanthine dehydrogenase FAD-binding subunit